MGLRIGFAGTPAFSAFILKSLLSAQHDVVVVYCQPDRKRGRGQNYTACEVKSVALDAGIPVEQVTRFDAAAQAHLQSYELDLLIVVAYGLLLPQAVLDIPAIGCVNIHPSLLPQYRGATPIQAALLAGDKETGVTLMEMVVAMDAGPILKQARCPIGLSDTYEAMHDRLQTLAVKLLLASLPEWEQHGLLGQSQVHAQATYTRKIKKTDAWIDWQQSAVAIVNQIRAYDRWPVAYTLTQAGVVMRIWRGHCIAGQFDGAPGEMVSCDQQGLVVCCGDQQLVLITQLQLPGKQRQSAEVHYRSWQTHLFEKKSCFKPRGADADVSKPV